MFFEHQLDLFGKLAYVSHVYVHLCIDVKNVEIKLKKNLKTFKNEKTWQKTFVNEIKKLPLLSIVQLHAWCPRNGLQGNSEYAIQFSFAETVVVLG